VVLGWRSKRRHRRLAGRAADVGQQPGKFLALIDAGAAPYAGFGPYFGLGARTPHRGDYSAQRPRPS
jgi:hypothetical protein